MVKDEKGRYEEIVATFLHYNNQWSDIYEKILCYIKQLKVQSSRLKAQGSKLKAQSSRFKVQGSKFKVQSSSFNICLCHSNNATAAA